MDRGGHIQELKQRIAELEAQVAELQEAAREVYRISNRDHEAWHRLAAALEGQVDENDAG